MDGKWVQMEVGTFLDTFVDAPQNMKEPGWKNPFKNVVSGGKVNENGLCESVIEALNKKSIFPGHKVVGTPHKADPLDDSGQKVDGGLYPTERAPSDSRNSWADQLVSFEWKRAEVVDDPFNDEGLDFVATSQKRKAHRGQIVSYASEVFLHQHRCFHFTVVILGLCTRIIQA